MPRARPKASTKIKRAMRSEQIVEMKLRGYSNKEIAEEVKLAESTVAGEVTRGRKRILERVRSNYEELQALEVATCDMLQREALEEWFRAKEANEKLNLRCLEIVDRVVGRRIQLLGLDKVEEQSGHSFDPNTQVVEIVISDREQIPKMMDFGDYEGSVVDGENDDEEAEEEPDDAPEEIAG